VTPGKGIVEMGDVNGAEKIHRTEHAVFKTEVSCGVKRVKRRREAGHQGDVVGKKEKENGGTRKT